MQYPRFIKCLCVAIACGLVLIITYQSLLHGDTDEISTNINEFVIDGDSNDYNAQLIQKPHMRAESKYGMPYDIFGNYAKRISKDHIEIYDISGSTYTKSNNKLSMTADLAIINDSATILILHNNVKMVIDSTHYIDTPYAKIIFADNIIKGNKGIKVFNSFSTTISGEYIYYLYDNAMVMNKDVRCQINKGEKILVTSNSLELNPNNKVANFKGDVVASKDSLTLHSKYLLVSYDDNGNVTSIDSPGHLFIDFKGKNVEGDRGIYDLQKNQIILHDNIVLSEKDNIIKGDIFVYDVQKNKFMVDHQNNPNRVKVNIETNR